MYDTWEEQLYLQVRKVKLEKLSKLSITIHIGQFMILKTSRSGQMYK